MLQINNLNIKTPFLFAITLAFGMFFGTILQKNLHPNKQDRTNKIAEIMQLVNSNYVDKINIDSFSKLYNTNSNTLLDSIENNTITQFLEKLDPHSVYLPPSILKETNESIKGEFAGIGVEYSILKDTIYATYILPNGPADKALMQIGDQLIQVGDSIVSGVHITTAKLKKLLRGEINTKINIKVKRNNVIQQINIIRGNVALPSIDAAYMVDSITGYIKLNKFSLTSYDEFKKALLSLKNSGLKQLLFDLRNNGGGILEDAVDIIDEFVEGKQLITYTEGLHNKKQEIFTHNNGLFEKGKLIVLIDEMSASASEVVAGALQDLDRATIVGRRSFGKGLVQQQFGLSDNSALRLTVARYYTPSGRSIQKPYNKGIEAYENDLINRYKHNGLQNVDSNKLITDKIYKTKNGKTVYGGGGITPDYFIALDTSLTKTNYLILSKLYEKNTLTNFCFSYYLQNKNSLTHYTNGSNFISHFEMKENDWQQLSDFCKNDSVNISKINTVQKKFLEQKIKEQIARQIWRNDGLFQAINANDATILKAQSLFKEIK